MAFLGLSGLILSQELRPTRGDVLLLIFNPVSRHLALQDLRYSFLVVEEFGLQLRGIDPLEIIRMLTT